MTEAGTTTRSDLVVVARLGPAAELHRRGVAENEAGHPASAARLLRRALVAVEDDELRSRILLSLAHSTAEQGSVDEGLDLLDQAERVAPEGSMVIGLLRGQRGVLLLREGDHRGAQAQLHEAIGRLRTNPLEQARALLNLAVSLLGTGDLAQARTALLRCRAIAGEIDAPQLAAKATNNLGYLSFLRGDLAVAMAQYDEARQLFGADEPTMLAVSNLDEALALMAAGLLSEADATLEEAAPLLRHARLRQYEAQTWLNRAEVALADGRLDDARSHARRAQRAFTTSGFGAGALLAAAIVVASTRVTERTAGQRAEQATQAAAALARSGLTDESRRLRLHAARRMLEAGLVEQAAQVGAESLRLRPGDALRTRLMAREVRADLALARGNQRDRSREIRAGLADLHRHQARLGSIDLQTSVVRHGEQLATMGLADALAGGRPEQVFRWLERTRALATRLPPVRPPEDARMADLLEALRHLRLEARELTLRPDGDADAIAVLTAACRDLERAAALRERQLVGSGDVLAETSISEVRDLLGESGQLVALVDLRDQLTAVVVGSDTSSLVPVAPSKPVLDLVRRIRADLDVLALAGTPPSMRAVVLGSLRRTLVALDDQLWAPVGLHAAQGPLVLVPSGLLATVPWTLLPSLRGRPLTVARSAGEWVRGHEWPRPTSDGTAPGATVFATGPRVSRADEEVHACAASWTDPTVLLLATPQALVEHAGDAGVLHVAAHGAHDAENPLFSSLELAGGLVFGHDLTRVHPPPRHVVLSACDLGLSTARPAGESLGMTAALLHGGTGSIVAG
ncbi:MAG: CHAT domain-containing protein, partial [Actinomycetota bacterium]|nr:CHAT domain-containing protein [Actinomycetota bacterium]